MFSLRFSRNPARGAEQRSPAPHGGAPIPFRPMAAQRAQTDAIAGADPAPAPARLAGPAGGEAGFRDVFTPTQPRALGPLFVGREGYMRRLTSALEDERAHVVLFGDRGRGKTSLANAFAQVATQAGYVVLRASCGSNTTFDALFRNLLAGVPAYLWDAPADGQPGIALPDGPIDTAWLTGMLRQCRSAHLIFIIDEFDRARSDALRVDLAEAIKTLSDASARATFLIVGVADSLDGLVGQHPSIQRNVVGIHLAPMAGAEIRQVVMAGAAAADLRFVGPVIAAIERFARGMPYYAHLLCLFAARAAAARSSRQVEPHDLARAVGDVLAQQEPRLAALYRTLTCRNPRGEDALFAAALAPADAHGRFGASALAEVPLGGGGQDRLSVAQAEDALRGLEAEGAMLRTETSGGPLHAFADPSLAHYVLFLQAGRRDLLPAPVAETGA